MLKARLISQVAPYQLIYRNSQRIGKQPAIFDVGYIDTVFPITNRGMRNAYLLRKLFLSIVLRYTIYFYGFSDQIVFQYVCSI